MTQAAGSVREEVTEAFMCSSIIKHVLRYNFLHVSVLTGSKPPGPASKTGATPLGKGALGSKGSSGKVQSTGKGSKEKSNSQSSHSVSKVL